MIKRICMYSHLKGIDLENDLNNQDIIQCIIELKLK